MIDSSSLMAPPRTGAIGAAETLDVGRAARLAARVAGLEVAGPDGTTDLGLAIVELIQEIARRDRRIEALTDAFAVQRHDLDGVRALWKAAESLFAATAQPPAAAPALDVVPGSLPTSLVEELQHLAVQMDDEPARTVRWAALALGSQRKALAVAQRRVAALSGALELAAASYPDDPLIRAVLDADQAP